MIEPCIDDVSRQSTAIMTAMVLAPVLPMKGKQANHPICVPSMFDSLEVEVLYPA